MANCEKCGSKLSFFGKCTSCEDTERTERQKLAEARRLEAEKFRKSETERKKLEEAKKKEALESIVLTTEVTLNQSVKTRHGIIMSTVECALDVKVPKAKGELLDDLKHQAYELGANAVVGIDIKFVETYNATIGVGELKKFRMIAYGTAITLDNPAEESATSGSFQ